MDNANKAILPTQISLTIDGMSGFVIGNLFKVDENFIPRFYKKTSRNMGYTITGLGHDISENDWTTTIQGYPVDLSSNAVTTTNPTDFSGIVYIDEEGNLQAATDKDCGSPTENIIPFLSKRNGKKISYNAGMSNPKVSPIFYEDFINVIVPFFEQYANFTYVYSATGARPQNPNSAHATGNAVDIQINGINKAALTNSWKGKKYSSWNNFRAGVNSQQNYSTEYDTSSPNTNHPYDKSQLDSIMKVHKGLISKFQGTKARGAFYYDLKINGRKYRLINEYLHPVTYSEGPHFHIMRICGDSASQTPQTPQSTPNTPAPTPNKPNPTPNNKPAPTPVASQPQPSQTPPTPTLPIPTPPTPSQSPTPSPQPPPTTPPVPSPTIMEAPSIKSTWKFPYVMDLQVNIDKLNLGNPTATLNKIEKLNGSWSGGTGTAPLNSNITDLDTAVSTILRKMYADGVKPKVTSVEYGDNYVEPFSNLDGSLDRFNIHYRITINESDDNLAWTGFINKMTVDIKPISDYYARNSQGGVSNLQAIFQKVKGEYGTLPKKLIEAGELKYLGNPFVKPQVHFRQIFYHYTDKNPEGIENK
jgi:hypothetical protein